MAGVPGINSGVFYPSYEPTLVKVSPEIGSSKGITFTFPTTTGATYKLYGSLSPTARAFITTLPGSPATIKVPTSKIIVPEETPYHFWVSKTVGVTETFIQEEPATVYTKDDKLADMYDQYLLLPPCDYNKATIPYEMLQFYMQEIRRRHVSVLEVGGEDFLLFIRRVEGIVCNQCLEPSAARQITPGATSFDPTIQTEQANPRFQGRARCPICFGTGITGGYYFPIPIKVSFQGFPNFKMNMLDRGMDMDKAMDAWTLWTPLVKQHDIVHRMATGERFVVKKVQTSVWKQVVLRQAMSYESLDADDMRVRMTDAAITAALTAYGISEEELSLIPT
jgi:hypothetical protein